MSASSSSVRRLALHPSALSDAEHILFTTSLADLADTIGDLEHVSVNAPEAHAWLCGRYAALESGTVDQARLVILRLFAPATTLSSGAFSRRCGWCYTHRRGAASTAASHSCRVRLPVIAISPPSLPLAPVPAAPIPAPTNPFLPTPAPSPEARARPSLPPRKPTSPAFNIPRKLGPTSSPESSLSTSASSASSTPPRRASHAYSSSLSLAGPPSPPMHPLRRASTQRAPASSPPQIQHFAERPQIHAHVPNPAQNQNPFRPAPPRPRSLYRAPRRLGFGAQFQFCVLKFHPLPLPLTLPKALRRTPVGAWWVGAERGEREGLVRGGGGSAYTVRNGRGA
ncbi:hypothetical protein B0H17DRAFT_1212529 [Mycena rosella]|uniref:Uncharacterized protein n=1 Tax=Mycena rosella TaxID=1033263 RepID=A0AAD7G6F7_MYCRO|nr:hypothetical protein B0H17DRAFT_1212529 [Mycena rosella]